MTSLGERIALLTNPTPQVFDPEDTGNFDTLAKDCSSELDKNDVDEVSDLRRKTAPLLEDVDPAYKGRKVSRKDLGQIFKEDFRSNSLSKKSESDISGSDSENSEEDDISDSDVKKFQKMVVSPMENDIDMEESQSGDEESENSEESESSEESDTGDKITDQPSNIDVTSEVERGEAVKNQLEIWNRLMEIRIKMQKLLVIANKLPQSPSWKKLKSKGGKELTDSSKKGARSIHKLLNSLIDVQSDLLDKNADIKNTISSDNGEKESVSDEEIPSDTDEEEKESTEEHKVAEKKGLKRKYKAEEIDDILEKRFQNLIPYRNSVIQKWDERTKLSTGRMTQKSFTAFDNSALKQIEQILQDKSRLIRRTQLKRSLYRVLGKPDTELENTTESNSEKTISKQDMLLKDYDPEVFDDDDFYRQILKDVIESKSFGIDPALLRKQMEMQKIRNKMKRKVDTRASKGRKLRFDVHPKAVNTLAPTRLSKVPDEARGSVLTYLFD